MKSIAEKLDKQKADYPEDTSDLTEEERKTLESKQLINRAMGIAQLKPEEVSALKT